MPTPFTAAPRDRLWEALSRVMRTFTERPAGDEQLAAWAGLMERFADGIEGEPPEHVFWAYSDRGILAAQGVRGAGELAVREVEPGQALEAEMQFAPRSHGAPDAAHGGDVATAFDGVMGTLFASMQPRVVTKRLDVRFLAPVPAGSSGRFDVRVTAIEGRYTRVAGELAAGGRTCATAEAEFVQLKE
jgi:acyl-coenzyme A thioesterase PaaI-like protein